MVPRRLNGGSTSPRRSVVMSPAPRERPRGLSRREFLRRSLGTAVVLPSAAAILAACSKPGTTSSGGTATGGGPRVLARPDNPVTLPMNGEPIPTSTPDRDGHAPRLQLGRLHVQAGAEGLRGRVQRDGGVDHVPEHGGGDPEARRRSGAGRRLLPHHRLRLAARRGRPPPAAQPRADPEPRGEQVEGLLGSRAVLRPRVAVHRAVHDLHDRGRLPTGPDRRRRGGRRRVRPVLRSQRSRTR